jgi:hypothetical protein
MDMIPQHSSATQEHFTPQGVVDRARRLLGGFDLDPASCPEANERVMASRFLTRDDDGLSVPWAGRVFLNPPGGKLKRVGDRWVEVKAGPGKSSMQVWWDKLVEEYQCGRVEAALFVGFTLEILRTSQSCRRPVQDFARCYPKERLPFRGDQPTHANVLVYLAPPGIADAQKALSEEFGDLGLCESGRPPF